MRILLVRHGQSEGNANAFLYSVKGDWEIGLDETGRGQVRALQEFLKNYYIASQTDKSPVVFVSPFKRAIDTLSGSLTGLKSLFSDEPKLYQDPRLSEKYLGATAHLAYSKGLLSHIWMKSVFALSKLVHGQSPFHARAWFGDSDKDIWIAVKSFVDGTLSRDIQEGKDDFLIFAHGRVIDMFIMVGAHLQMQDLDKMHKIGNCDVIEISGEPKNWTFRKIYDGKKMQACDLDALNGLKPFTFADLPPAPDHFLKPQI